MSNQTGWAPHVTVAAVIVKAGRYLLVEESTPEGIRYNQPAGHWEAGESLLNAVAREVYEETTYRFTPDYLVGIYTWQVDDAAQQFEDKRTYLRFVFHGQVAAADPSTTLDPDIIATHWLSYDEIAQKPCRNPMVLRCIEDFQSGQRLPLTTLVTVA